MERSTATLLQGLEATHQRVGRLLAGLRADAWTTKVPATPAWSVADVVAHLADADAAAIAVIAGRAPERDPGGGDLDAWTAAGVAAAAGTPPEALAQSWEATADALRWRLEALEPDGWGAKVGWVAGPISVRTLAQLRLNDAWLHGRDLAEAVGAGFDVDPATLAWMADLAVRVIPGGLARAGRARPGAVVLVRLGDAGEWLVGGAPGERPGGAAQPDLTLEAEPLAFVLRAARRTGGTPWRASGDEGLAADIAVTIFSVG